MGRIPTWQEIAGILGAIAALLAAAGWIYKWTMRDSEIRAANAVAKKDEATAESNLLATATAYINRQEARIKALEERCDELQETCDKIQSELNRYRRAYPTPPIEIERKEGN